MLKIQKIGNPKMVKTTCNNHEVAKLLQFYLIVRRSSCQV